MYFMNGQVEIDLNVDDLLDDAGVDKTPDSNDDKQTDTNQNTDIDENVVDTNEPNDNSNDDKNDDDIIDEDVDYMTSYLSTYGIEDGKIKFENEDGTTEEVDFNSLSNREKVEILKDLADPGLTENEIETINYLRRNNATLQDVVEYYNQKAIREYIEKNGAPEVHYSVDDYSDDEMYLADAKSKYPEMSEEELLSDLESAKENETLFTKKVEAIRKHYKAIEDKEKADAEQAERDRVENFKNSIQSTLDNFNEISLDYTDAKADSLTIEPNEKNKIFEYLTKQDSNGMTKISQDLQDPQNLIDFAWWKIFGQESISNITKYYQKLLIEARKEKKEVQQKAVTARVPKTDKKEEDSLKYQGYKSFEIKGYDHLL